MLAAFVLAAVSSMAQTKYAVSGTLAENGKTVYLIDELTEKAIGQLKMPWLQISDLKGWNCAAAPIYKIDGIPDNILIDPQGKIIDRALRGKALHTRLEQLLNM